MTYCFRDYCWHEERGSLHAAITVMSQPHCLYRLSKDNITFILETLSDTFQGVIMKHWKKSFYFHLLVSKTRLKVKLTGERKLQVHILELALTYDMFSVTKNLWECSFIDIFSCPKSLIPAKKVQAGQVKIT